MAIPTPSPPPWILTLAERYGPVLEASLALLPHVSGEGGEISLGDIVAMRLPHASTGRAVPQQVLKVLLSGASYQALRGLVKTTATFRRRYGVPWERLQQVTGLALDDPALFQATIIRQPLLPLDRDDWAFFGVHGPPLDIHGLVYDKCTGGFL